MKFKVLFSSLIFFSCFSYFSSDLPLSISVNSGYRFDQFNYKILSDTQENELVYEEKFKSPQYWQSSIAFSVLKNGFYLSTDFNYAQLLNKKMKLTDTDMDLNEYLFDYIARGYDLDSSFEVGFGANLTPDRVYKFLVMPIVGYSGFWKFYKRKDQTPDPDKVFINGYDINSYSSLSKRKLSQIWYGPYIGGKLIIIPNNLVEFDLSYHFNWMKLKLKFNSDLELFKYDQFNELSTRQIIEKQLNDSVNECYSHLAALKVGFFATNHFKIAFTSKFNYFLSEKEKAILSVETKDIYPTYLLDKKNSVNKVLSRWWNVSGVLDLIFKF